MSIYNTLQPIEDWPDNLIYAINGPEMECRINPSITRYRFEADLTGFLDNNPSILREREIEIIFQRYKYGVTLQAIAKKFGVTRERIRQQEQKAIRRLRYYREYLMHPEEMALINEISDKRRELMTQLANLNADIEKVNAMGLTTVGQKDLLLHDGIESLDLTVRSYNCLKRCGIDTIETLVGFSKEELSKIRNLGRKSLQEIIVKVHECGLKLKGE